MAINKVVYGNQTLIDLTTDTVASSDDILAGKVGHLRDGTVVTGTASGGDQHGTIWQDGEGYVHLDDESGIALESKSVTPSESQQVVEAGEGYYALDKVTVGAISSSYVGSGVSRRSSSDLTASGATVTAPAGYYSSSASKAVASGTAGTPTATKGTVSNHAITVTPSVTNTTGYITGGTKTGTAVTVTASELVNGSFTIASSGFKDVTNYKQVYVGAGTEGTPTATKGTVSNNSVIVTPSVTNTGGYIAGTTKTGTAVTVSASELVSGTKSITENGTGIDVTNYASVDVNVVSTPTYTATVSSNATSTYVYVRVNDTGQDYSADGSTFTWTDGDNIVFRLGTSDWDSYVYVNGERVKHSYGGYYTYTPPSKDISINIAITSGDKITVDITYPDKMNITENGTYDVTNYASVDVNVSGSSSSSYELIASTTYVVNTSSTTSIEVGTFETGDTSIWTSDKMVFIKIRDTAGRRNGYYYGTDAIICNNVPGNGLSSTTSYMIYGTMYYQNTAGYLINMNLQRTQSSTAITGYGIYPTIINNDGSISINARYSSSGGINTQTINGTFKVDVYLLDWPGGVNPFNG